MTHKIQKTNKFGIALMLTLGLAIAGCGQQTAPTEISIDANNPVSSVIGKPEARLQTKTLGSAANGYWNSSFSNVTQPRPLAQFNNFSIQNGLQAGTQLAYSFTRNGEVLIRTGILSDGTLSTAYLVRIPGMTDHFEGWYTLYNPTTKQGLIAYFEMKRNRKSSDVNGNDWNARFDPKPMANQNLSGGDFVLENPPGFPGPGGKLNNVAYIVEGNTMRRSGSYSPGNGVAQASGYMMAVPGTNTYVGWYGNSDTQAFNIFTATKKPAANNTWEFRYRWEPPAANQKSGTYWKSSGNGTQTGTNLNYTIDAATGEMFRTGTFGQNTPSTAHLVRSFKTGQAQGLTNGTDTFGGWYALNGNLNYFDASKGVTFKGASIAGLEFGTTYSGPSNIPGVLNQNYWAPRDLDINTYMKHGMNTFRIPFRWERLQYAASDNGNPINTPGTDPKLNAQYLAELDRIINTATSQGANVILDMHNYGSYYRYAGPSFNGYNGIGVTGSSVTSANLATIWYVIADRYKNNRRVLFGLMNEPLYQNTNVLKTVLQDAINAIRQSGATNPILVNGNYFTGAWSWNYGSFGLPSGLLATPGNSSAMMSLLDPSDNLIYEAHQYFDPGFSGSPNISECNPTNGAGQQVNGINANDSVATKVAKLFDPFTTTMRANGKRGFLGEVGVWQSTTCQSYLRETLKYLEANNDVWTGWAYWAAGSKWDAANQMVLQVGDNFTSRPQLNVLKEFLPQP
jgi:endoglucanase